MSLHKIKDGVWVHPNDVTSIKALTVVKMPADLALLKALREGSVPADKPSHIVITSWGRSHGHIEDFSSIEEARAYADSLGEKINALTKLPGKSLMRS